ncbi:MAG: c-type cytochrome [Alcaligenaceae bacterium]|nr:c-type cytochrome [Alcaligenaceae bacterium]
MSTTIKLILGASVAVFACSQAMAQSAQPAADTGAHAPYGFGTDVSKAELAQFFSSIPDGRDLPEGSGTVMQGKKVYDTQCLACHGAKLEGGIGNRLIGGRGTLDANAGEGPPIKTVESYWPYATTLLDYIKRAMPFTAPGSLSNDDAYAVTAYILNQAHIVPDDAIMSKETLPKVEMPNRNGFRNAGR